MSTHRETADRIINAMIVDDDSLIVESLATILSAQPDINVCATASGGTEAVQIYAKLASESVSRETSSARTTKEGAANATAVTATDDVAPSAAPDAPAAVPDDAPAVPDNAPTATLTSATVAPDAPAPNDAAPVAATDTAAPATPAPDDATPASAATLDAAAPTTAPDTPTPAVPDVLLMDIRMPDGDGLSAAERILADYPQARIIFLTTFADDDYIVRALRMGARGYLIKQDVATIAPALRSVMAGQNVLGSEVMERAFFLGNVSRETSTTPSAPSTTSVTLSPAEASALSTSSSPAA
ncbi:MAG: DNA-binding response regulator, partial [Eggerthellaceae bacterium]|nr:DNA-binding response regulator [Eggerthellaceae bacterium]